MIWHHKQGHVAIEEREKCGEGEGGRQNIMLLALQIETEATSQRTQVMAEKTKKWILPSASGLFY